jgi:hypothetical protein
VNVPTGFSIHLLNWRRCIVAIAIAALVLQTLIVAPAGVGTTSAPGDAVGVICHHNPSGSGGEPANIPDPAKARKGCCAFCTAAAFAIVKQPTLALFVPRLSRPVPRFFRMDVAIARMRVRDGRSQAPPSRA